MPLAGVSAVLGGCFTESLSDTLGKKIGDSTSLSSKCKNVQVVKSIKEDEVVFSQFAIILTMHQLIVFPK